MPYRDWLIESAASPARNTGYGLGSLRRMVSENTVVLFARRDCCMCHVMKLRSKGHGVNPTVFDYDDSKKANVVKALCRITGADSAVQQFPAVFMGGDLLGGVEEIMGAHISGELVARLRQAGALWL